MKHQTAITTLVIIIVLLSGVAASIGIFSTGGPGPQSYETIRGITVTLHGYGIYRHMSQEVAPQGIAQDYVTLLIGVPLLVISLIAARKGSLRGKFLLAGTLTYFLVTYLFYLVMAMFNALFLVYIALLGTSFFAFSLALLNFDVSALPEAFSSKLPRRSAASLLLFIAGSIALLWFGIVVPPLIDGSIIPPQVEHYTTLVVQGLDLGLLLPAAFVTSILLFRKRPFGYLFGPVYFVFLSVQMTALIAKIIAMGLRGENIVPVVFIIPVFAVAAILSSAALLRSIVPVDARG